jgi:hypothetical protein
MEQEEKSIDFESLERRLLAEVKPEPDTRTTMEKANDELKGSKSVSTKNNYDRMNAHMAALKNNKKNLEYAIKASSSPVLKTIEAVKAKITGKPNPYTADAVDGLIARQYDISSHLADSLRQVRMDAESSLMVITDYRDKVFKKYSDAIMVRNTTQTELDGNVMLHNKTVEGLQQMTRNDPRYTTFALSEKRLRRRIMKGLTAVAKANTEIEFAMHALESLGPTEEKAMIYAARLDQAENYATNALEFGRNQKRFNDMPSGGEEGQIAAQFLIDNQSATLALQASYNDATMQKSRAKASQIQFRLQMPQALTTSNSPYTTEMFDRIKADTVELEKRVNGYMNQPGYPST